MKKETVSFIMPVHNQQDLVVPIARSIISNMSENIKEIIIIFDGCTDNSEDNFNTILNEFPFPPIILHAPNIFEVRATNLGFKTQTCDYSIFGQDDMLMVEKEFDQRLLKPFKIIHELLCVSSRDAVDVIPDPNDMNMLSFINVAGRDVDTPRNIFAVRDAINRGHMCFNNVKAEKLGFMDEIFAPQNLDDVDIGMRGYREYGWLVGAYECKHISELAWGTSRKDMKSYMIFEASNRKNHKIVRERYSEYFLKEKHSADIIIE
jgi:glycosyltransferase involved in cell wall biosynthesis